MKVYLIRSARQKLENYIDSNCDDIQCFEVLRPVIETLIKLEQLEVSDDVKNITVCGLQTNCSIWYIDNVPTVVVMDIYGIETLPQTRIGKRLTFNYCQIFKILKNQYGLYCGAYCGKDVIWFPISKRSRYREGEYLNVVGTVVQTSYDHGITLSQIQTRRVQMRNETKHYKRIRLTETQLHNIIRRCINEALRLRR